MVFILVYRDFQQTEMDSSALCLSRLDQIFLRFMNRLSNRRLIVSCLLCQSYSNYYLGVHHFTLHQLLDFTESL